MILQKPALLWLKSNFQNKEFVVVKFNNIAEFNITEFYESTVSTVCIIHWNTFSWLLCYLLLPHLIYLLKPFAVHHYLLTSADFFFFFAFLKYFFLFVSLVFYKMNFTTENKFYFLKIAFVIVLFFIYRRQYRDYLLHVILF